MSGSTHFCVEQLKKIIEFRETHHAPVDTMGCLSIIEKDNPKIRRFQLLIALMLSSQTKDQYTSAAMGNLRNIEGGLVPATLSQASPEFVFECIQKVRFAKQKAINIIEAAKLCHTKFDDDIPQTVEDLTAIHGVGIKMATNLMQHCWGKQVGIAVDIHLHRISNLLGWVKTKNTDQTKRALEKVFPEEYWPVINKAIVGFGQEYCTSKKPKCMECPIRSTCHSFKANENIHDLQEDI